MDDFADLGPGFHQNVLLSGKEHAHTINGFEVSIHASKTSSLGQVDSGSSKVKITTVTNQNWKFPDHHGRIVASNNKYLSYVLEGRNGYVLRLIQQETNTRSLLKGFVGAVVDVSFCHANSNLLACVDQGGNLYIWDLDNFKNETPRLLISQSSTPDNMDHRLVWNPHVPTQEDDDEEQEICNIVLTHGKNIEVLDIHELFDNYASDSSLSRKDLACGFYSIPSAHEDKITDLSLSPDGSVLATASEDGHLKFWQVTWEKEDGEQPKCLHDFSPHKGAPVSQLIFCDNRQSLDPGNQYWRFLITAAKSNTEIKIWCTVNWKCLQTLRFFPPEEDAHTDERKSHINLGIDLSASYLIVTDSNRMAILVFQLFNSAALGDASITSVTEYLLTQPIINFNVCNCAPLPVHIDKEGDSEDDSEGEYVHEKDQSEFDSRRNVVLIKLHCIHTKSMQELQIRFEPPDVYGVPASTEAIELEDTHRSIDKNGASLPVPTLPSVSALVTLPDRPLSLNALSDLPKLATPSEFTSPAKVEVTLDSSFPLHPLLSPASIMALSSINYPSRDDNSVTLNTISDVASSQLNYVHQSNNTLGSITSVTPDFNDPSQSTPSHAMPSQNDDSNFELLGSDMSIGGQELKPSDNLVRSENVVQEKVEESNLNMPKDAFLPTESSDEEEPTVEELQKTFDNIIVDLQKPDLAEPGECDQREIACDSLNQGADEEAHENEQSAISSLEVTKSASDTISQDNADTMYDAKTTGTAVSQWPNIEPSEGLIGESDAEHNKCDISEVSLVSSVLSNESHKEDYQLPNLMPSAFVNSPDTQFQSLTETSIINTNQEVLSPSISVPLKVSTKSEFNPTSTFNPDVSSDTHLMPAEVPEPANAQKSDDDAHASLLPGLLKLVSDQHNLLCEIKREQQNNFSVLQDQIASLKASLSREQRDGWTEIKVDQQQRLDRILKEKQVLDKQKQDKLISTLSHTLTTAVNAKLDKLVKIEMKNSVVPAIQQSISSLQKDLSSSVSRQLTTTDKAINDGISQLIQSQSLPDAVGKAMVVSLQRTLPAVYEDVFTNVVLVSFERTCQEMFKQIDDAFRKGTVDYLSQLQQFQHRLHEPTLQGILSSVQDLNSVISDSNSSLTTHLQGILQTEITSFSQNFQQVLVEAISSSVQKEVGALNVQANKSAQIPNIEDKRDKIMEFVRSQDYNSAYELALSTSDLHLVIYLCQQVDPDVLFDKVPCLLCQPVLLSLIQQLSVNLQDDLELKLRYLDQCVLVLDVNDDVTKNHMGRVMKHLCQQMVSIQEKCQSDPNFIQSGLLKQIKRLHMVSQHLCH